MSKENRTADVSGGNVLCKKMKSVLAPDVLVELLSSYRPSISFKFMSVIILKLLQLYIALEQNAARKRLTCDAFSLIYPFHFMF